jgi:hypothetical protein
VRSTIDRTIKKTGDRVTMDEIGLYTLKNGKIAGQRFSCVG